MKAVIVWESSAEEENQAVAQFLASLLEGYDVRIEQGLDGFLTLSEQDDLIVPVVSGATIIPQQLSAVLAAGFGLQDARPNRRPGKRLSGPSPACFCGRVQGQTKGF